jgi:hypothetical protein
MEGGKGPSFIEESEVNQQVKQLAQFFTAALPYPVAKAFAQELGMEDYQFFCHIYRLTEED